MYHLSPSTINFQCLSKDVCFSVDCASLSNFSKTKRRTRVYDYGLSDR